MYYLSSIFFWSADCPYFALKFEMDDTDPYRKMCGINDLIESQCAHYMNWSGRFFCQLIVQIFCAFTTRPIFEICNAFVWIVFLISSYKLTNLSLNKPLHILVLTSICFFIFLTLPLDPPFLINYLWMATIVLIWLIILFFNKSTSISNFTSVLIYSIIAGNSQEAFSIPISGALSIWIFIQRKKILKSQWFAIIGFALGTLILIIAPGNFARLGLTLKTHSNVFHNILNSLPLILISLILILSVLIHKFPIKNLLNSKLNSLLLFSLPFSLLLALIMKFENLSRILIPFNIFLSILIIGNLKVFKYSPPFYCISLSLVFIIVLCHEYQMNKSNNQKYSLITNLYHSSADGKVFLPDSLFIKDNGNNNYYNLGFVIQERAINPQKPFLKILPESLARIKFTNDTNFIMRIGPQSWIFGQSINKPHKIYIKKTVLPGFLNIPLSMNTIDMTDNKFLTIDTINDIIIGSHTNQRWYLKTEICLQ